MRRLRRYLDAMYLSIFGFDYFIAYTWKDRAGRDASDSSWESGESGRIYAEKLRDELQKPNRDMVCFLDSEDYARGQNWRTIGQRALRATSRMIVILSPGIMHSEAVRDEIAFFQQNTDRLIVPVKFDAFRAHTGVEPVDPLFESERLHIKEPISALVGGPSPETIQTLLKTFDLTRQTVHRRRVLHSVIVLLSMLLIAVGVFAVLARIERNQAISNLAKANRQTANVYWQVAMNARDQEQNQIRGSHLFLRGANTIDAIPLTIAAQCDTEFRRDLRFAAHASDRGLMRSYVHDSRVLGARFFRMDACVLTWSADKTARTWDTFTGAPIRKFTHDGIVLGAELSGDETRLLTWSGDNKARVWNTDNPNSVLVLSHVGPLNGARFAPHASKALTWSGDNTARVWNVHDGSLVRTFAHEFEVDEAQFSDDATRVLTRCNNPIGEGGVATLWNVEDGTSTEIFRDGHAVRGAQLNKTATRVLAWTNSAIRAWDVASNPPSEIHIVHSQGAEFKSGVYGGRFVQDQSLALIWAPPSLMNSDAVIGLFDVGDGKLVRRIEKRNSSIIDVKLNHDETHFVTRDVQGVAQLWDLSHHEPLQTFAKRDGIDRSDDVCFDDRWSQVATWTRAASDTKGGVRVWKIPSAPESDTYTLFEKTLSISSAQLSRDGSRLLTCSDDGAARLWDVNVNNAELTFNHHGNVGGAIWNHDNSQLLAWSGNSVDDGFGPDNGEAVLWDIRNRYVRQRFKHEHEILGSRLSRDERRIVSWSVDKRLRLWDSQSGNLIREELLDHEISDAFFSQDGNRVLTLNCDLIDQSWHMGYWSLTNGEYREYSHRGIVSDARFNDDGSRILLWGNESVTIWNSLSQKSVGIFPFSGKVLGACISTDKSRLLVWGSLGPVTAQLWDVARHDVMQVFSEPIAGGEFSPDSSRVLTWDDSGTMKLWTLGIREPIMRLRHEARVSSGCFSHDGLWILGSFRDGRICIWSCGDPMDKLTTQQRILELEARSGSTLDSAQNLRTLTHDESQERIRSALEVQTKRFTFDVISAIAEPAQRRVEGIDEIHQSPDQPRQIRQPASTRAKEELVPFDSRVPRNKPTAPNSRQQLDEDLNKTESWRRENNIAIFIFSIAGCVVLPALLVSFQQKAKRPKD